MVTQALVLKALSSKKEMSVPALADKMSDKYYTEYNETNAQLKRNLYEVLYRLETQCLVEIDDYPVMARKYSRKELKEMK